MLFKYEEGIRTTDKMLFSLALWDTEYFGRERSIVEVVSLMKRAKLCNSTKVRMRHLCHLFVYTQLLLHNDNQDASICKAVAFIPSVDIPQLDFSFAFTQIYKGKGRLAEQSFLDEVYYVRDKSPGT